VKHKSKTCNIKKEPFRSSLNQYFLTEKPERTNYLRMTKKKNL